MAQRLRLGPPVGAAGVVIYQDPESNSNVSSQYGSAAVYGITKRGPMGVAVPLRGKQAYQEMFGDRLNPTWHLFKNSDHLVPDWVDGFFGNGGGDATLLVTRLQLDGKAKRSELILNGRNGQPVLKIKAANEGRWAGGDISIPVSSIVAATSRTFTVIAPGILAGQLREGFATFSASSKKYAIISNTAADATTGEVVFTVGSQYNLIADGISGPVPLVGTATYVSKPAIVGTVAYAPKTALTGVANITGKVLNGTGTLFTTELAIGSTIYRGTEARTVESISSDATLTVSEDFSVDTTGSSLQTAGLTVVGTGTAFTTDFTVGATIFVDIAGVKQGRKIAAITSATSLKLTSGFTAAIAAGSVAYSQSTTITGVGSAFVAAINVGDYIIDPYRSGQVTRVTAIPSATSLTIATPFNRDFAAATISKQNQVVGVDYLSKPEDGLSITVGQGVRKPETHFSMSVLFNGATVLQVDDLSLERGDPDYVVSKLLSANAGYDDGTTVYAKYVEAEVLWNSAYTTAPGSDVRPSLGNGKVLALSPTRLYSVAELDYNRISGTLVYPDIYGSPSSYFRAADAKAPAILTGTFSSVGTAVTGVATSFTTDLMAGDYLYDPASKSVRKIQQVDSDTSLVLIEAFAANVVAGTVGSRAGWISVSNAADLSAVAAVGSEFITIVDKKLSGGYDGDTASLRSTYWTRYADLDANHLETTAGAQGLGLVRVACPGVDSPDIQRAFASYCLQRAYEFRVEIPSYMSDVEAERYVRISVGKSDAIAVAYPSYGFAADPDGNGNDRFTTTTGDIMGGESALAISASGYHKMYAGVKASLSPRIKRMVYPLTPIQEARLNERGIQPVKIVNGTIVVFGGRAPSASEQYEFIHTSRIQKNLVRFLRESVPILEQLFEPNDSATVKQLLFILNKYSEIEYAKGVFSDYLPLTDSVDIYDISAVASSGSTSVLTSLIQSENGKISINFKYIPAGITELIELFVSPDRVVTKFGNAVNTAF
jgi:hypothetical protein